MVDIPIKAVRPTDHRRVILISCGKAKGPTASPARDLYTGGLFRAARRHAEASGSPWAILSALHGLLDPHEVVEPYDHTARLGPELAHRVLVAARHLAFGVSPSRHPSLPERHRAAEHARAGWHVQIEVHAGRRYAEPLLEAAEGRLGLRVTQPLEGLQVGQRLAWYNRRRQGAPGQLALW